MSEKLHITVSDIGEDALIKSITHQLPLDSSRVVEGSGDDCAVLKTADPEVYELQKADAIVENSHFLSGTDPELVGWKAVARAVSDIAAMGISARPVSVLITIAVAKNHLVSEINEWYAGMRRCAEKFNFSIVGGESVSLPKGSPALISVAMVGEINRADLVLRSGARVGDFITVSGKLGGSFESGRHLSFEPRIGFDPKLKPTAMMDLSDGLAKDLPRLARASGVGYALDFEAIPRHDGCDVKAALTDGEDYELLMTLPESPPEDSGVAVIGRITETIETPIEGGWDHFSK